MEQVILTELLSSSDYGWLGWLSLLLVAITITLSLISKNVATIISNLKIIQIELGSPVKDYQKQMKNEADVTEILRTIRHDMYADRVLVMQYHNGMHSIVGNHFWKVSATHEALGKGVTSMLNSVQSWPSNYLGEWNAQIFENNYIVVNDKVDLADNPGLRGVCEFLNMYGVDKLLAFPIADSYGKVFGVGMVHITDKSRTPDADMIKWASQRFYAVGALLAGTKE